MEKKFVDLFDLQARLKTGVEALFPDRVWVKAEIASLNRKPNSHCYLELSQSRSGSVVAKARAAIWASRWPFVDQYFKSVTGSHLDAGMEILARVQVSYHVLYGLTLTIDEIDPEFTLGANERQRQQTIERLTREGLMSLQKQLRLPLLPYSLAVISASGAAGYGDFCHHLLDNEYGFVFDVRLFEAAMQGEGASLSIREALSEIVSGNHHFDAVLIMRGGGSDLDLACFDDYDLAVAIARCPVPVFTAIGHDKDHHVADMVANAFVKTPTALADLFLDCYVAEDQRLGAYESRLQMAFMNRLSSMTSCLELLESRIALASRGRIQDAEHRMDRLGDRILHAAGRLTDRAATHLDRIESRVRLGATSSLSEALSHLMQLETKIETTDPRNILRKGFVLALDRDGVKIGSASGSKVGDRVQMMFADGTLKCGVVEVDRRSNIPGEEDQTMTGLGS